MRFNSKTFSDVVFIEDELGITLNNLTTTELKILANACGDLALMPHKDRVELFSALSDVCADEGVLLEE